MLAEKISCLGVNHQTAPVEIREKMAFSGDCLNPLVQIKEIPGCDECCFLSTCNRVEVLLVAEPEAATIAAVRDFLFAGSGLSAAEAEKYSYLRTGEAAINHVFRVASSLDSMVLGEPQILGQLKDAYRLAMEHKATGPILHRLLSKSFSVAKRIRTETSIGSSAVSISFAAVQLARKILGDLTGKTVLLAGAGEMAELAAEHLLAQGIGKVVVANRTLERAVNLARRFNGEAASLAELVPRLAEADILISSTGSPELILRRDDMAPLMRQRYNRPIFLIDIAVPRDLDPGLNDLDNIYLYDIDDLQQVVEVNKGERRREADRAERIVEEEAIKFLQWLENMELAPTITELRRRADELRRAELSRTLAALPGLTAEQQGAVEKMSGALVNKLLHHPMLFLKSAERPEDRRRNLLLLRKVFGLDNGDNGDAGP
ncbi:glutamyl-tRNA reductase [Desulfurivibrio alkaliphilus]|uniref:Glutamyl-tRNA reductase n=1 Tax=Desulfurivibrio alkaliphilus (strain DSM 19089 / UNIQEM U267 / AHT2) TaxID=589865 RepID=D6Z0V6_DESAT|nr:glutamyl-tRNA reductase [Desulfurivibrio alkaliphilus]ADH87216.1 glutamyl-tRNA reductase [Desulfurivibrio alkaliphilus AHT 2]